MKAYLRVEQMGVHHGSFDIVQVGVVFESSLQQSCLLTQLSDMGPVIVCEHLVPQDRICYLKMVITHINTQIILGATSHIKV